MIHSETILFCFWIELFFSFHVGLEWVFFNQQSYSMNQVEISHECVFQTNFSLEKIKDINYFQRKKKKE